MAQNCLLRYYNPNIFYTLLIALKLIAKSAVIVPIVTETARKLYTEKF